MNPPAFQGSLSKKNYFEGWYLKNVSKDLESVISFIPGISLSKRSHAFIQVIDGTTGWTEYFEFDKDDFKPSKDRFHVRIGENRFSLEGLYVNLEKKDIRIKGELKFQETSLFPKRFLSPGIMGWYTFVPRMECYHGVVSMDHELVGSISFKEKNINMNGGKGYIEKDWGTSFPESWIWLQCNNFDDPSISMMLSIAKIPWMGSSFTGFLSFIKIGEKVHRFATYTGAKVSQLEQEDNTLLITLKDRHSSLNIEAVQLKAGELAAPISGNMDRRIKESVDSEVKIKFTGKDGTKTRSIGKRAGLEIMADMEELK